MAAPDIPTALAQMRSGARAQTKDTICGVHRILWTYIDQLPEPQRSEAEALLAVAYVMGSKMSTKLVERKKEAEKIAAYVNRTTQSGA